MRSTFEEVLVDGEVDSLEGSDLSLLETLDHVLTAAGNRR